MAYGNLVMVTAQRRRTAFTCYKTKMVRLSQAKIMKDAVEMLSFSHISFSLAITVVVSPIFAMISSHDLPSAGIVAPKYLKELTSSSCS